MTLGLTLYRKHDETYWNHGGFQESQSKRQRISRPNTSTSITETADN